MTEPIIIPAQTLINQRLHISNGEVASGMVLSSGGSLRVSSGGMAIGTIIRDGGTEDVFRDGITSVAHVSSGGRLLLAGGKALDTVVSASGSLYVRSYGTDLSYASGAQILSGGFMDVYDYSVAEGTVIQAGGYVRVRNHGSASNTLIMSGASMYVHSSNGYACDTVVSGFARVYDGALMSKTTIASGGSFHVWRGGILKDVDVRYGGLLDIRESAPVLSGEILVAGQLKASYNQNVNASGATIILDLSSRGSQDDYSIINWDYLGETTVCITVAANQATGIYKLASRAGSFDGAISLTVAGSDDSLTLTIGHLVATSTSTYTLARGTDNALTLAVGAVSKMDETGLPVMSTYQETDGLSFGLGNISEFTWKNDVFSSGYVCCIGGIADTDWTVTGNSEKPYIFVHDKITDAEKADTNSLDDLWCGEMTETNMVTLAGHLNRCGWQSGDQFMVANIAENEQWKNTRPLSKIFEKIDSSWAVQWGSFDRTGAKNTWLQQADAQLRSGSYIGWFQVKWGTPDKITGSHAMTLLGFTYDARYEPDDPRYYSGVVLSDSDDNKWDYDHASDAPNLIKVERIVWDDAIGSYWFRNGYLDNVWTIKKMDAPGTADLTWYQPNAWSGPMTVNTRQNATHDQAVLRTEDVLLLNFAVTNTGMAESGRFHVALYVDDVLKETFKVSSLEFEGIAAIQNYRLGKLTAGKHVLKAVIDSEDVVVEGYETNNIFTKDILIIDTATQLQVSSGTGFVVSSNESAANFAVLSEARVHLRGENAEASNIVVSSKGTIYVSSGGLLSGASVLSGGYVYVSQGGYVVQASLENFLVVSSGGTVVGTIIRNGGTEDVFRDGITSKAHVSSGGRIWLAGGKALDTVVSAGGSLAVRSYGTDLSYASGAQILSGGFMDVYDYSVAEGTVIQAGGYVRVRDHGSASNTLIMSGASMYVHSSNGYACDTVVSGFARVYDGALMSKTTIASGASFHVWRGGILQDVDVQYGGLLDIRESAPVLSGEILVAGQLKASYNQNVNASGATIILDLSSRGTQDDYSIVNWDYLGRTNLSIKVAADQTAGIYKLASRVETFNQPVTVTCADGASAVLYKGIAVICGDYSFLLDESNSVLSLSVTAHDSRPPVLTSIQANTTELTNQNVMVTATFTDNVGVTAVQRRLESDGTWMDCNGFIVVANNTTVYFRAFDEEGNVSEVASYKVTNIDKTAPTITNIKADVTAPTTGNVVVSASFADNIALKSSQYRINGGTWQTYADGVTMTSNGTVSFQAIDSAGNSATASYNVANIDRIAPTITDIGADVTTITKGNVIVTAAFADNLALKSRQYRINDGSWQSYTTGATMYDNGTVSFLAIDSAGNSATASYAVSNIDKIAPTITDIIADVTSLTNSDVIVTAAFADNIALKSMQYRIGNDFWQTYVNGATMTSNGKVTFRAIDIAGNSSTASCEVSNIDKTAPTITSIEADVTIPTTGNVIVTAAFADDNALTSSLYRIGDGEWMPYVGGVMMASNGTVYFLAVDSAGNSATANYNVANIDRTAPTITDIGANITAATNDDVIVTAAFSDNMGLESWQYRIDDGEWLTYVNGATMSSNGTVSFLAVDRAGNSATASCIVANIDRIPPEAPTVAVDITIPTNQNVTVTATFSADSVRRYYSLGDGNWSEYSQEIVMSENGTVSFYGVDEAGNISEITSCNITNIDRTSPSVVSVDVSSPDMHGNAFITVTASEPLTQCRFSWNGGDWQDAMEGIVSVSENGSIHYRLVDLVGNETISEEYTIDVFNVLITQFDRLIGQGGRAVLDWGDDATTVWARTYDWITVTTVGSIQLKKVAATGVEVVNASSGDVAVMVKPSQSDVWTVIEEPLSLFNDTGDVSLSIKAENNGLLDMMFVTANDMWGDAYQAQHVGIGEWEGTGETVKLAGKNRMDDVFIGSDDASILLLTDDDNGDALFIDDIYSAFPEGLDAQARVAKIDEIRAGDGDDIVDLTSQRFDYVGGGMTVHGGLGDDVIWANSGDNTLFGDAGNDRIVGAGGNDVIVGCAGNDSMHGGGGEDIFAFGGNWGNDKVEQLSDGKVTLWFENGDESKWDDATLSYQDGENSVKVEGVAIENVTLKFGDDGSEQYGKLLESGVFDEFSSEQIFEKKNTRGVLA